MKKFIMLLSLLFVTGAFADDIVVMPLGGPNRSALETDLIPSTDNTYDLGSTTKEWKNIYVDGTGHIDTIDADAVDITGITDNNIPKMGASGFADSAVSDDGTTVTSTNKVLINTTGEPGLTVTQTSISGTDNQAIDIIGGEALGADEDWTGIRIKPDDLDPSGVGTRIRGLTVNTSGVDTTNNPDMDAVRINTPIGGNALTIIEGLEYHSMTAGSGTDSIYTVKEVVLDVANLDVSSTVRALNVEKTGAGTGTVIALCAKPGVAPLCQQLGTYVTPSQTEYAARFPDGGAWTDGIDGEDIFVAVDDAIYIGSASEFGSLEVILSTAATKTVFPDFYYYNTSGAWVQFYPGDGTDGFVRSGIISWSSANFTNWKSDYDPGGADGSAGYYIKIVRDRVANPGTVAVTTIKTLAQTFYGWNSAGNVTINGLTTQGGQTVNVTTVNAATYDLLTTDYILNVTYTATGAVTSLTLPTAQCVSGRIITIKDAGGNAGTNSITIDTEGAETIDGSATLVVSSNYASYGIYSDGSNWFIR